MMVDGVGKIGEVGGWCGDLCLFVDVRECYDFVGVGDV